MLPTLEDIRTAARNLEGVALKTPLLRSEALEAIVGAPAFVKAESLQRGGAFKIRGAYNKIVSLSAAERANGVLAYSSGNHAIGTATAARMLGIPAVIVMPADAPRAKIERTKAQGAEVVTYERLRESREEIGARIAKERGLPLVKPFDDAQVMAGQGTIGLELIAQLQSAGVSGDVVVLSPASGGGLAGGIAIALEEFGRVYAVEPEGHDDLARSRAAGRIVANEPGVRSICDALLVEKPGEVTFEAARDKLAGVFAVSDNDVCHAVRFALEELKLVLEPSGAAALAAALRGFAPSGSAVVVIASGGNVDAETYAECIAPTWD